MIHPAIPGGGSAPAAPADSPADSPAVSLAVVNGRVWTGRPHRPWADALAVRGDRLAAVGSSAEIRKLAGPTARVVDARGGLVVAGDGGATPPGPAPLHEGAAHGAAPAGAATADGERVLAAGAPASFAVFDRGPSGTPPAPPPGARIVLRVVGGTVVVHAIS